MSIALCTYNGAAHLPEQLDSLLAQTFQDFEIVAVDDGSTDQSPSILEAYALRDRRLRWTVNARNVGHLRNFEMALRDCRGQFIAPCDQDDVWLPEKIAVLLGHIGDYALAYCDSELMDEEGRPLGARLSLRRNMLTTNEPACFVFGNCAFGHASLFRRALLAHALPMPDGFYHDWWLAAVAAAHGGVVYCDRSLVQYRQHPTSVTNLLKMHDKAEPRARTDRQARKKRDIEARVRAFPEIGGRHRSILLRLRDLWQARSKRWAWFSLGYFLIRHHNLFYATTPAARLQRLRRALRHINKVRQKKR